MKLFIFVLLLSVSIQAKHFKCNRNLSCGCGSQNVEINARIINGEEAVPYSWSMIVSIRYNVLQDGNFLQHACGGTILTESYILTAASCLADFKDNIKSANVTIAAGIHRRSQPFQIVREVDDMIVHPKWISAWDSDYDIALLHLSEPLNFQVNSLITRTCLSAQLDNPEELVQYPPINTTLAVVGWGRTVSFGDDSDLLRQIIVSSIDPDNTKCANKVMNPIRQFCAGLHKDSIGQRFILYSLFYFIHLFRSLLW
jgi:secreted trypsin-like serine protease